jgi:NAD+ kinase
MRVGCSGYNNGMTIKTERKFQHAAILWHPKLPTAGEEAKKIADFFHAHQVQTTLGLLNTTDMHRRVQALEFDLLVALGGDGTMLRTGHLAAPLDIPILGINLGHLGFLIEVRQEQWDEFLPRLFNQDYWIERRMTLCADQWRTAAKLGSWEVLNEVVVCRGQEVRSIKITAAVDGRYLTTYVADALIVSTPTGSTAYALAAGGPILPPELRNILLVPVAPHLSLDRAIVLAEGSSVSITIQTDHQAVFSVDGQVPVGLTEDDRLEVRASEHTVKFIRFQDPGYFYRNLTPHMNQNPSTGNTR